jgi:hypothetical protein
MTTVPSGAAGGGGASVLGTNVGVDVGGAVGPTDGLGVGGAVRPRVGPARATS